MSVVTLKEICDICTEDFSTMHKNYRHKVCPYCQLTSCYKCIRIFLLSSSNIEPTCMGCRAVWGLDFISSITPTNFHNDEYRKYRARLLLEREKSLLPDTQNLVSIELEKRKRKILLIEMEKTIIQLKNQIWDIRKQIRTLTYGRIILEETNLSSKTFIKQCPVNECRGYLSSVWKCGICDIWVCSKCHIPKNGKEDIEHICEPGLVETAKLLQKETKACPSCSVPIYKIEGCDQMWCTQCKTPFSWKTGKIETGTVHNPHYYQWQRSQNDGVAPRVPGDVPNQECNILPRLRNLENRLALYFNDINEINIIFLVHRIVNHIREVELHRYPNNPVNIEDNSDLRVAYLLNELSDDKWKSELKKREKKREKNHEIHLVYNMAFLTLTDIIQSIYRSNTKEQINNIMKQLEPLREYINKNLLNIHNRFQNKVQYITSNWVFTN